MSQIIDLHTEVVHRHVLELRYLLGHLYWDRCGRVINDVISSEENWDFEGMDGATCRLAAREQNLQFAFSASRLDLSQTQGPEVERIEEASKFAAIADSFSTKVIDTLQLSEFSRIGFRAWYLYPTEDRDDAEERVRSLRLLSSEINDLPLGTVSDVSCRLVVEMPSHMVRAAIAPFEQLVNLSDGVLRRTRAKARDFPRDQKRILLDKAKADRIVKNYPQFGVLVDLDAFMEDPPCPEQSIADFVRQAEESFAQIKNTLLEQRA